MSNKRLLALAFSICMATTTGFASNTPSISLDFEKAVELAIANSQKLSLRDEMMNSISEKNELQKKDYSQNNPDYVYDGITKTEQYTNTYKTYDYEKILKNITKQKKSELIQNEKKTFGYFKNIYDFQKQLDDKKLAVKNRENIVTQSQVKLKNKLITPLTLANEKNKLDLLNLQLQDIQQKLSAEKSAFKTHLGLDEKTDITLVLTEPDLSELLNPNDALAQAMLKSSEFIDLKDDMDELISDMKWIDSVSKKEHVDQQQELIDKKQEDIDEKKRITLYSNNQTVNRIFLIAQSLKKDKIENRSLQLEKQRNTMLKDTGISTQNTVNDIDYEISQNLLAQNEKILQIRQLMLDYYTNIRL